ncbi:MAG: hypothetical protein II467_00130, partial [Bacilli bacterium]|nr:hypothetical protein [Bacilli bacterium]
YPHLEEIVLPEGIVNLPSFGFFCSSTPLKRITFPSTLSSLPVMNTSAPMEYVYISEGIETIPSNFFWGTPIDWVYIPSTVKTLWKGPTLCNAGKLFYRGTPEQWEAITFKANGSGEYPLDRPRFYYSESAPTDTEHNYWHFENGVPTEWPNN